MTLFLPSTSGMKAAPNFRSHPPLPPGMSNRLQGALSRKLARYLATKRVHMQNLRPLVSFTFDDVPDSAFIHGARTLENNEVRGTFYIAGSLCGTHEPERRFITAAQCIELHSRGHEIGCHTFSHSVVQWLDADALRADLDRNRAFFEALVPGLRLENFCYPYGVAALRQKLQMQARFRSCRSSYPGINVGGIDIGMLKGVPIDHATDAAKVAHDIERTVRCNGWLIFFTHDVHPIPTWIGCTPQFLSWAVATALERGCEVVTVSQALRRVGAPTT